MMEVAMVAPREASYSIKWKLVLLLKTHHHKNNSAVSKEFATVLIEDQNHPSAWKALHLTFGCEFISV